MLPDRGSRQARRRETLSPAGILAAPDEVVAYDHMTGAARVGADLRAAREQLGWTLPQIAAALRIRLEYLAALEAGDVRALPGMAYALGFLRTYGTALGMDSPDLIRRLKAAATDVPRRPELSFPAPVPERGVPAGAVVLLSVVLAAGAYVGWYRLSGEGRLPAEVVPPVPERLAPLAEQAVPSSLPPKPVPLVAAGAGPNGDMTAAFAAPSARYVYPSQAAAAMPLPTDPVLAPATAQPINPDDPRIVIRAKGDAWIQVRDKAGPIVLNRTLHPGDTWPVPPRGNLLLTTGNAGGTELLVDGVVTASIGGSGSVRRDLPLDPDQIKDGKLAAPVPPASAVPKPIAN